MSSKFLDKTGLDTLWTKIKATFQTLGNLVTSWSSTPSDTKYPSEKLVKDSLDGKLDKVDGATSGNFASFDSNGSVTDSGSKPSDFKTVQTAVSDPAAIGSGLSFIDSISQNTNGEITPHKKTVQDGTTSQKGVVQLSNAIDSSSSTTAATSKAVKDAYDELNNKIVARATFLSQAEWAEQSLLPGDPAKVYYVEDGTGEDAYTVYVWNSSTNAYVEVDESSIDLDGYWHDGPTTTGNGNVVTSVTLGIDGVPVVDKGMSAEPAFSVLPISKGGTDATTADSAANNLLSALPDWGTDPTDGAKLIRRDTGGTAKFGQVTFLTVWNYIKGKISSVLGLTSSSYSGNAATATKATQDANGLNIAQNYALKSELPSADSDTYYVSANSTAFSDALAAFNAGKKLILLIGTALTGSSAQFRIPLNRVIVNGSSEITQFAWVYTQDNLINSTNKGVIEVFKLSSSGWTSTSLNVYYSENAGSASYAGSANQLDDWASTSDTKIAVGWDGSAISKVTANASGSSSMSESFHLAAYAGKTDGIAKIKDVRAINVQVGDAIKWNGWSIVVGSTGSDANTLYFV